MTTGKKYTVSTSTFYAAFLPLIPVANCYLPNGPCNPGLGFLLFMMTPFMAQYKPLQKFIPLRGACPF
jgi:hypothetical protein